MSMIVGVLLACAAGLAGTVLCPPDDRRRGGRPLALAGTALLGAALFGAALSASPPARAGEFLSGSATVLDGGSLMIADRRVRLQALSAPDRDQTCWDAHERTYQCGRVAAQALAERIGDASVTCEPRAAAVDGIATALCRVGDEDLGAWMVGRGYAMAARQDPHPYAEAGARAWGRRLGLWSGVFQDPDAWRQSHRLPVARLAAGS
ncbi:hypothetical protein GCM10007886_30090 [Methylobacterium gregans]|uniref:Nuclease (SNase domain protein) n=1 Tax=Methylobacterium gregans TaxID=374424 RepID=A0AA37HV10_9HYPH|nr:thermonuclease family protein [Methylobacterium gregans]MDQ0523730.1 endonuclease YncB(thermonuclease family) [Methylobacterium gregans]GJD81187.1 hypothetical protein NBEOAGPD_4432 [Methylobacterium gregans]GLS54825.1 hypothetical protein GCM10007886_30090 [Methylobacterium gregans]